MDRWRVVTTCAVRSTRASTRLCSGSPHDFTARADKFFNTDLDQTLKQHGIQTLVLVGSAANGAILYTSFGANERGYTVVVATDGISSGPEFDTYLAEYQLLNEPGFANAANDPLHANAVTLSRGDLITFGTATK